MRSASWGLTLFIAGLAEPASAQDQRPSTPLAQSEKRQPSWELEPRLPLQAGDLFESPSQFDEMLGGLPLEMRRGRADEGRRGFQFSIKPGRGVRAIARLRF